MSLTATLGWHNFVADITTAFLQGQKLDSNRSLWIQLPSDARKLLGVENPRCCTKLKKPIYGVCDAPRSWYLEAVRRLESLGYVRHVLDPCLFLLFEEPQNANEAETDRQLVAALGLHVDDLFGIINPLSSLYNKYLDDLKSSFSFRDFRVDLSEFEFPGAQVEKTAEGGLFYHHANYLGKVKPITISKERVNSPDLPITEGERTQLRAAIGAIQWAATQTSPHLQAHTSYLARTSITPPLPLSSRQTRSFALQRPTAMWGWNIPHLEPWTSLRWSPFLTPLLPVDRTMPAKVGSSLPWSTRPLWKPAPPASTTSLTGGVSNWHEWRGPHSPPKVRQLRRQQMLTCLRPP